MMENTLRYEYVLRRRRIGARVFLVNDEFITRVHQLRQLYAEGAKFTELSAIVWNVRCATQFNDLVALVGGTHIHHTGTYGDYPYDPSESTMDTIVGVAMVINFMHLVYALKKLKMPG
jgi:hypothetical protein